jgi:response regulator RpfG family c-di-GMP phosphodiesterase
MKSDRILLVDDEPNILASLVRHLRKDNQYEVATAENGEIGLAVLGDSGPFSLVVSDFRMPGMTGVEFLSKAMAAQPDTVRIMLTGQMELEVALDAINKGKIFRFLMKPISPDDFLAAVNAGVEQYRLITAEKDLMEKTLKGSVKILFEILSLTNPETFNKSTRLRQMAQDITTQLAPDKTWEAELAALLCQIGVVILPKEIQDKKRRGEPLNEREQAIYFSHPKIGKALVSNIPRLESVADAILYQYKNYDGGGTPPGGPKGKEIPFTGRLLKAISDYDDLINTGNNNFNAIQSMWHRWGEYDPEIMAAIEKMAMGEKNKNIEKTVSLEAIEPGMTLARDILDQQGRMLYPKDTLLTEVICIQLRNFYNYRVITKPAIIYENYTKK